MSDEEYANIDDHLQSIAFAWNTVVSSSLGVSPFEVMTGTKPRTLADGFVRLEGDEQGTNTSAIRVSAAAYTALDRANADYMRDMHARALNKHGTTLKEMKVSQHVKIMVPPNRQEAIWRGPKAKHLCSWRGPMRITAIEGTRFYLEYEYDSKVKFERHLTNIRK